MRLLRFTLLILLICTSESVLAQLQIVPQNNAQALAQKLVGSGVIISKVKITGSNLSTAFFYNRSGSTQLGIDSGIVLSTGRVIGGAGFNGLDGSQNLLASNQIGTDGDADLNALVKPRQTGDAVILEFDFIPVGDSVKFRYVFSSEEYPIFTCSNFNDVFAFFISGPGFSGSKNIALVPGTNIPVAINSINSGTPGNSYDISTCNSMGPGSPFTQYYVDNTGNNFFTHNGHTTVLTAAAAVIPCNTYHLKIAIADVQDRSYDSGVFLEAESLKSDPLQIIGSTPVSFGTAYLAEGCHQGGINVLRKRKSPAPVDVNLVFAGTAVNGVDVQKIPSVVTIPANDSFVFVPIIPIADNQPEGIESLKIYVSNGCLLANYFLDSIQIQIRDYDTLAFAPSPRIGLCMNNAVQLIASSGYATYQWTPAASLSNAGIYNPLAAPDSGTTYICSASLGICHAMDSVRVEIKKLELISKKGINCRNGTGEIKVSGGWEWKQPVQYSINNKNYGTDSVFTGLGAGNYTVRIRDASGCIDSMMIQLPQAHSDLILRDSITTASCFGLNGRISLSASGGQIPYAFKLDNDPYAATQDFMVPAGPHTISVSDYNGCVETRQVRVDKDPPISVNIAQGPLVCNGDAQALIHLQAAGGDGHYEYSIDGVNFQGPDSFLITNGNLDLKVRDDKGCSLARTVYVPLNEKLILDAGQDTAICQGDRVQLHATGNAQDFLWDQSASLSDVGIANPIGSPQFTTKYFITGTRGICSVRDSVLVTVYPAPVADAGPDSTICLGRTIALQGSGGQKFSWLPVGQVSNAGASHPVIRPSRTSRYFLKVFDVHGCPSLRYDTVEITVVEAVKVDAGRDTTITLGQPLQLNGKELTGTGANIVEWSPSFGLSDPHILDPVAILTNDLVYRLKLSTSDGCEGNDEVAIKVFNRPDIFVPTGFTPNDDGKNDVLKPIPVGMKAFRYFSVYNRWGQLVFSSTNERNGWDGKVNGVKELAGTFIWLAEGVDYKGNTIQRRGVVTLIR
ncbi:MAG TPA: choice-of-anchor L domain-containing protein [Flavisolibacter sp.]|nr:choice-of-anchor L domain-containing protein [Flavisolibacter sp.]